MEQENDNYKVLIKWFADEFSIDLLFSNKPPSTKQEEILLEIFTRVNDIYSVFERLSKYQIFFEKFYPDTDGITEADALEYHINSYLEDLYSLKSKISRLTGLIKNKLKFFDLGNPEVAKKLLIHIESQVSKGLNEVANTRGQSVHDMTVRDPGVTKAKLLKIMEGIDAPEEHKELLRRTYNDEIKKAKDKYIKQAESNSGELKKLQNFFAPRIGHLIAALYDKDQDFFAKAISGSGN